MKKATLYLVALVALAGACGHLRPPPVEDLVIPCDGGPVAGLVENCKAPCGCTFEGRESQEVTCQHGTWFLDP